MHRTTASARTARYSATHGPAEQRDRITRIASDGQYRQCYRYQSSYECPPSQRCQSQLRDVNTQNLLDTIDLLLPSTNQPSNELSRSFDELARSWKRGTLVMSSSSQIYAHDAYRQIVDLGEAALPFVFSELRQSNDIHWIQALAEMTDIRLKTPGATPDEVIKAWLKWGSSRGLVS